LSGSHFDGGNITTVLVLLRVGSLPPETRPSCGCVVRHRRIGNRGPDQSRGGIDRIPERVIEGQRTGERARRVGCDCDIAMQIRVGPHLGATGH